MASSVSSPPTDIDGPGSDGISATPELTSAVEIAPLDANDEGKSGRVPADASKSGMLGRKRWCNDSAAGCEGT